MRRATRERLVPLTICLFALLAVVNWWMVIDEGPSTARILGAIAGTIGAVLQAVAHRRRRASDDHE